MSEQDGILLDRWESTGDNQAFMEIVARYQAMIYGVCLRIVRDHAKAEDLVQECFLKLTHTRPKKTHALGPWLHRIATNESINQLRTDNRRAKREEKYTADIHATAEATWDDINEIIDIELNALPEELRAPIIAHYLQGYTQVQVAETLDIPRTTVTSRIKKGLDLLHQNLKSRGITIPAAALSSMMTSEISHAAPATLTSTMGKAVLRGAFQPPTQSSAFLGKALLATTLTMLAVLAYLILNPKTIQPDPIETEIAILQTNPTAPATLPSPPTPEAAALASTQPVDPELILEAAQFLTPTANKIRLRCIDESGSPVQGALVYVLQIINDNPALVWGITKLRSHQADGPLTSDQDGYVEFTPLSSSQANKTYRTGLEPKIVYRTAYAIVPGERVGIWQFQTDQDTEFLPDTRELIMRTSRSLPGQILLPSGYDISSVKVDTMSVRVPATGRIVGNSFGSFEIVFDTLFPGLFDVPVDASGRFEIHDTPTNGTITIRAQGKGLGEEQRRFESASVEKIVLSLAPHGVIEGTVQFADYGKPAAHRQVFCRTFTEKGIADTHATFADANGNYRFEDLSEGVYEVVVAPFGYPISQLGHARNNVVVESGYVTESVDFKLEAGTVIRGTMTNTETGKPIEGVLVAALSPPETGAVCINSAISDASGNYELRLPAGDSMLYIGGVPKGIEHLEGQGKRVITIASAPATHAPVNFEFNSDPVESNEFGSATITGRVLDQNGNPAENAVISEEQHYKSGGVLIGKVGTTDKDGLFSIKIWATGEHTITIGGGEWSSYTSDTFEIARNETKVFDDIYLDPHIQKLSVQILDRNGNPIPDAHLLMTADHYIDHGKYVSDAEGMIYIKNLPDQHMSVVASKDGYSKNHWNGFPGTHIQITLRQE